MRVHPTWAAIVLVFALLSCVSYGGIRQPRPDPALHGFLRLNFAQLAQRHGGVRGVAVPRPKMVPLSAAARE